jgi:hypothetical protein
VNSLEVLFMRPAKLLGKFKYAGREKETRELCVLTCEREDKNEWGYFGNFEHLLL